MSVVPVAGSAALPLDSEKNAEDYEFKHVHEVYEEIAPHFSATRFKPWPIVERFLLSRPTGSVGLDIGCGNGKYLDVNPEVFMIGSDRSSNLAKIGHEERGHETIVCDALDLPHPLCTFDFAISIAVIHHFSSRTRRVAAIKSILSVLKSKSITTEAGQVGSLSDGTAPGPISGSGEVGEALIYVWALEQKASRRGWDENSPQDMFVPWVLQKKNMPKKGANIDERGSEIKSEKTGRQVQKGQAQAEVELVQASNKPDSSEGKTDTPSAAARLNNGNMESKGSDTSTQPPVYMRYYHLFRKGELEEDVTEAGGLVCESGYEKDNWWAIIRPGQSLECSK